MTYLAEAYLAGPPSPPASKSEPRRKMASKSSPGVLGWLFRGDPKPVRTEVICRNLSQSLVKSADQGSTEDVRSKLCAAMALLEEPAAASSEKTKFVSRLLADDMPAKMLEVLPKLEFEAAKDAMWLFNQILQIGTQPVVDYIRRRKEILQMLLRGCGNAEVSLHSNVMVRSCVKQAQIVELLFEAGFVQGLLNLVRHENFDVSSDAFCSVRELLLAHKNLTASHIVADPEGFFGAYNPSLLSEDYFTKRQSLRLLADIVLDPSFAIVLPSYVSNDKFLQIIMNLLRDDSKVIQSDALRVFSAFVAEPEKSYRVHRILFKNRERLVRLLDSMGSDGKGEDETSLPDRGDMVQTLLDLPPLPMRSRSSSTSGSTTEQSEEQALARERDYSLVATIQWHPVF